MNVNVFLIVAALSALVGLLCLYLAFVAWRRIGRARKGLAGDDTPGGLKIFALRQLLSAIVMLALAGFIILFS